MAAGSQQLTHPLVVSRRWTWLLPGEYSFEPEFNTELTAPEWVPGTSKFRKHLTVYVATLHACVPVNAPHPGGDCAFGGLHQLGFGGVAVGELRGELEWRCHLDRSNASVCNPGLCAASWL